MNEIYENWLKYRPAFKTLREWKTGLPPLIIKAHQTKDNINRGNVTRLITGDAGVGKSTYAYKILAKVYWDFNGYTRIDEEEECYRFALENMIYRPQELFSRVQRQIEMDEQALVWCLDDASIHMGRQLFDQDREMYRKLQGTIPTLRENVSGLLITTINTALIAKPLREFIRRKVTILPTQSTKDYARIAKHYEKWYFPDDVRFRIAINFQDKFSCLVPEPFYTWYHEKKMKALKEYNESIMRKPVKHSDVEDEEEDAGL